ncbi:Hsp20/alpha crystallin family protein [Aestuariibaculum suncheonense]|uniref:Hsp20/alpha crystallin family protein n=1 Tax=Aestuariibaculum suncheonense TaxID=1028745 RepID=A0A8J6UG18_9FLAO|nr:Hsp20/alpha crystallin family protein [Aestuariibaculum suncheonense]MBD0834704.1 Hsp20/alpha crystallin family protein [Aestuariibaculum suncheonense]
MTPDTNVDKKPSYASFYNRQEALQHKKTLSKTSNLTQANIKETEHHYHYELKIPGYIKDDFNFYIAGDNLVVTTERRRPDKTPEKNTPSRHSYCYPSALFKRKFELPDNIIRTKITVEYCDEVLSFKLFKQ